MDLYMRILKTWEKNIKETISKTTIDGGGLWSEWCEASVFVSRLYVCFVMVKCVDKKEYGMGFFC